MLLLLVLILKSMTCIGDINCMQLYDTTLDSNSIFWLLTKQVFDVRQIKKMYPRLEQFIFEQFIFIINA